MRQNLKMADTLENTDNFFYLRKGQNSVAYSNALIDQNECTINAQQSYLNYIKKC